MNVAKYIYETPDTRGSETIYGDASAIDQTIAELIDAGGPDWATISIDECTCWGHVDSIGGLHIYVIGGRRNDQFIVVTHNGNGFYERCGWFRSEDDARDYAADQR